MTRHLLLEKVYPITDSRNANGLSHVELATAYLNAGCRFLQVRKSGLDDSVIYSQLLEIRVLCDSFQAQLLVNDRVDLALAIKADGVHLGQTDLPVKVVRQLVGKDAVIGLSTHNHQQFIEAQTEDIDYVSIGPVFPTSTKETPYPPLGPRAVGALLPHSRYPVVAIGGITLGKALELLKAGVRSVAVISDIANHPDPQHRVAQYLALPEETGP